MKYLQKIYDKKLRGKKTRIIAINNYLLFESTRSSIIFLFRNQSARHVTANKFS